MFNVYFNNFFLLDSSLCIYKMFSMYFIWKFFCKIYYFFAVAINNMQLSFFINFLENFMVTFRKLIWCIIYRWIYSNTKLKSWNTKSNSTNYTRFECSMRIILDTSLNILFVTSINKGTKVNPVAFSIQVKSIIYCFGIYIFAILTSLCDAASPYRKW